MENRKILKDGKEYTRVSDVVGIFRGCYDPFLKDIVEHKAAIGTEVHHLCKQYVCGEECDKTTNARVQKYFECFQDYYKSNKLFDGLLFAEERFFDDDLMITGQADFVFKIRGREQYVLVDLKTSATIDRFHWWLQGILYAKMIHESGVDLVDSFTFIQLQDKPDKRPEIVTFPAWKQQLPKVIKVIKETLKFKGWL